MRHCFEYVQLSLFSHLWTFWFRCQPFFLFWATIIKKKATSSQNINMWYVTGEVSKTCKIDMWQLTGESDVRWLFCQKFWNHFPFLLSCSQVNTLQKCMWLTATSNRIWYGIVLVHVFSNTRSREFFFHQSTASASMLFKGLGRPAERLYWVCFQTSVHQ